MKIEAELYRRKLEEKIEIMDAMLRQEPQVRFFMGKKAGLCLARKLLGEAELEELGRHDGKH